MWIRIVSSELFLFLMMFSEVRIVFRISEALGIPCRSLIRQTYPVVTGRSRPVTRSDYQPIFPLHIGPIPILIESSFVSSRPQIPQVWVRRP